MGRSAAVVLIAVAVGLSGLALEGPPLTEVIYGSTAYTLPGGTWELAGYLSLPVVGLPSISINYGVTDALQLGTGLSADLWGLPNLGAKLALGQTGPVAIALPVSLAYSISESTAYLAAGLAMSSQAGQLGFHSELAVDVLPGMALSASFGLVYEALESVALLGEVGVMPLRFRIGTLLQPFSGLDLRVWVSFPGFSAGAKAALRF